MKLNKARVVVERVEEARLALLCAFPWHQTEQGYDYWQGVDEALENILWEAGDNDSQRDL